MYNDLSMMSDSFYCCRPFIYSDFLKWFYVAPCANEVKNSVMEVHYLKTDQLIQKYFVLLSLPLCSLLTLEQVEDTGAFFKVDCQSMWADPSVCISHWDTEMMDGSNGLI